MKRNPDSLRQVQLGGRVVHTRGLPYNPLQDLYHLSMTASWTVFIATIFLLFVSINLFFAVLYGLDGSPIANLSPPGFAGRFFFSVETFATVGYGDMHPQTWFGHLMATVEIFSGVVSTALITGLIFARFSRPRARIMFARHPVVSMMDGQMTLMIRAANARQNVIVDASARLRLIIREVSPEGASLRRLHDLVLVRDQHPIFLLGWNLMHRITPDSPLFGIDAAYLADRQAGLILTISGVDETTGQTMQARENYDHSLIRWQHRYVDMFVSDALEREVMDYTLFDEVLPVDIEELEDAAA